MPKVDLGNMHEDVKTLRVFFYSTSKFEVCANIIVITKATNIKGHGNLNSPQKHRRRTKD
jgi:hypothetical protein